MSDPYDEAREEARKKGWPPGSRALTWDDTGDLGIMEGTGQLLWRGREVVTKQQVSLRGFELFLATVVAVSSVAMAVFPILVHFKIV